MKRTSTIQLPPTVPLEEVASALGDSVFRLKVMSRRNQFPKLIRLHRGNYRVLESDLRAWCEERGIPLSDPQPQGEQA